MGKGTINPPLSRGRLLIAAGLGVTGLALLFFAQRAGTRTRLALAEPSVSSERSYSQMWFDGDTLLGTSEKGTWLTVDIWSPSGSLANSWRVDLGSPVEPSKRAVGPKAGYLAWVAGSGLQVQPLAAAGIAAPGTISLDEGDEVLGVGFLPDGSLSALLTGGKVQWWDPERLRLAGTWQIPPAEPEQIVLGQGSLAVAAQGQIQSFIFEPGRGWRLRAQAATPPGKFQLIIPAPGVFAALQDRVVQVGNMSFPTAGSVRSVAGLDDALAVSGEFGIAALDRTAGPYILSETPAVVIARSPNQLVTSDAAGTQWRTLAPIQAFTTRGWAMLGASALLLFACAVLIGLAMIRPEPAKPAKTQRTFTSGTLPTSPEELVQIIAEGNCAIWSGAGLSAQSGYPTRGEFVEALVNKAAQENWVTAEEATKLLSLAAKGEGERAVNQLVAAMGERRPALVAAVTTAYSRYSVPSLAHEALGRLAPNAVITTSYDEMLERSQSGIVKLFGSVAIPSSLIFSRFELQMAARATNLGARVRDIFATRSVLCVGCSLDGLLEDLETFGITASGHKNFAICGVAGPEWEKAAEKLSKVYGVEVISCSAHTVHAELTEFLIQLAERAATARERSQTASPQLTAQQR